MNPWEMNLSTAESNSVSTTENKVDSNVKPWDMNLTIEEPKPSSVDSMSLVGALKGTEQTQSPFIASKPTEQPIMDLVGQRTSEIPNEQGTITQFLSTPTTEEEILKSKADEAQANVEAIYNRYSTQGNYLKSLFGNKEAKAKFEADTKFVINKKLEELRALGIPVDYRNGQLYGYDSNGKEIAIEDTSMLKTLNKSKFEAFGAAGGAIVGASATAKYAPGGVVGKAIGGAIGGIAGGYLGAREGARVDGILASLDMASKVDDGAIYQKMDDAGIADIVMGTGGMVVGKAIVGTGKIIKNVYDFVAKKNLAGAEDAMIKHLGIDEYEAKRRVKELEDLIGPLEGLNDSEKILYTLTQTQRGGEAVAKAAGALDPLASTKLANIVSQRAEGVLQSANKLDSSSNLELFRNQMDNYTKEVKKFYIDVKDAPTQLMENYKFNLDDLNIQGVIDNIDNSIANPYIKQRFKDTTKLINDSYNGGTFGDLIDLRQAINDIRFNGPKLDFKESTLLKNIVDKVDTEISSAAKTYMPESKVWEDSWAKAKNEYAQMKSVEKNVIYKALTRPGINEDQAVNILSKYIKAGDNTFYEVMDKIQSKKIRNRIEGSVLNKLVNQYADGIEGSRRVIHFPGLSEELKKVSWQSPKTKQLVRTINRMAEVFKNDIHLAAVSGNIQLPRFQSYLTTDPIVRLKFEVASSVFNTIKQFMPTQSADTLAMATHVGRLLENPISGKSIEELKRALPKDTRTFRPKLDYTSTLDELKQAYVTRKLAMEQLYGKDMPPRLAWRGDPETLNKLQNPEATILPSIDKVLYASERGSVGTNPSEVLLGDRTQDYVTEYIWRNTVSPQKDITEYAMKYMDNQRFENIMTNVNNKLVKDNFEANVNLVANSIKSEAGILIKRIEKDFGIKMPKDQAEKIIALKYKEIMEKCNGK